MSKENRNEYPKRYIRPISQKKHSQFKNSVEKVNNFLDADIL
jgi:hypothetical protein